jgi:hypothetical protein
VVTLITVKFNFVCLGSTKQGNTSKSGLLVQANRLFFNVALAGKPVTAGGYRYLVNSSGGKQSAATTGGLCVV